MSSRKSKSYTTPTVTATPVENAGIHNITTTAHGKSSVRTIEEPLPEANRRKVVKTSSESSSSMKFHPPNEAKAREFLTRHGWTVGLQEVFLKSCKKIPIRYIITDDSGSMVTNDGHRLIGLGTKNVKMIQCTRWSELTASLGFHAELAHATKALTEFRLLNNCEPIMIGKKEDMNGDALNALLEVFEESPGGQTPLCYHISEVIASIAACEQQLRAAGQKACVVIATDGESTDGDLAEAMKPLQDLPVWVVVRLCTDEDQIVEYWNNIDTQLELEMDVLDDFSGEATEVMAANPWLSYGDSLQKLREFGATVKEMDLLDESALSSEQMRVICAMLVCDFNVRSLPHPDEDWAIFINALKGFIDKEQLVWDPISRTLKPWIDIKKLTQCYGGRNSGALRRSDSVSCSIQ